MTKQITPEMIAAWRTLQAFALRAPLSNVGKAINTLDNSDWMVPIEDAENDQTAVTTSEPDPAEWADTTRADMDRHQSGSQG